MSMAKNNDRALPEYIQVIKDKDPDRFLLSLFCTPEKRAFLYGLYALNLELAKTRQVVKEIPTGQIRLQWWQDEIDGLYQEKTPTHPASEALKPIIQILPQPVFHDLIDGWEQDLFIEKFQSVDDVVGYIDSISKPVFLLANNIEGRDCQNLVSIARVWGLSQIIRAMPVYKAYGRDLFADSVTAEKLYKKAMQEMENISFKQKSHLVLYAVLAKIYLRDIEKKKFNTDSVDLESRPFGTIPRLILSRLFANFQSV